MSTKALTKDQILDVQDLKIVKVAVPEWGGHVFVKGMTGAERDSFEASCIEGKGKNRDLSLANIRAKLVARTVVDKHGNRLFDDKDAEKLGTKSAAALERVFSEARKLSGISNEDVEELAKNSESDQSENSGSD